MMACQIGAGSAGSTRTMPSGVDATGIAAAEQLGVLN